jgi:pimeloyl-ACP methyl ester carboxylesterase
VTVSGTETWLPGSNNVDDISTDVSDVLGVSNLKQEAIAQAMRDAGVTPQDDVLLVGHSQGGADAVNFAANPELAKQFHVTGVLTAGAPESIVYPTANVPVVQLRTPGDVVPSLGLASTIGLLGGGPAGLQVAGYVHDALLPGNVDIVNLDGPLKGVAGAHATANYAADAASSTNQALAGFASSQHEYLTGEPSTTYVYSAQRTPGDFWSTLR